MLRCFSTAYALALFARQRATADVGWHGIDAFLGNHEFFCRLRRVIYRPPRRNAGCWWCRRWSCVLRALASWRSSKYRQRAACACYYYLRAGWAFFWHLCMR